MVRKPVREPVWKWLVLLLPVALWPAHEAARAKAARSGPELPPIVFVSRAPLPDSLRGQVPGLGPHGTFAGAGGRLLELQSGRVRELVPAGRLFDVADPAVSDDGTRVAFAARERADSPWRIWSVSRSLAVKVGEEPLACMTCDGAGPGDPGDDADPTWWGDTLLYVSTRGSEQARSLYDRTPVTQLWVRTPDGRRASVTHEANGVLDPVADVGRRRLLFSRWWFNPWHADPEGGVTRTTISAADSVNLWQVVSARLVRGVDGKLRLDDVRLAAGGTLPRRSGMGIQPEPLAEGMLAVATRNMGLAPRSGTLALVRYANPPSAGRRLAGAAIGDEAADAYTEAANLRAPAACAPAALENGRIVCAVDPGGRGDFGLWLLDAKGDRVATLVDSAGAWELDPATVPAHGREREQPEGKPKRGESREVISQPGQMPTFRYLNLDVFGSKGDAKRQEGARLNVYRLDPSGILLLVAQAPVPRTGRVDLTLPAEAPLFEMLVDAQGRALMTPHGPAQVRGFNAGAHASTSRCSGCHLGHSTSP